MNVIIDAPSDTCTFVTDDVRHTGTLSTLVVTTDPERRMSVVDVQGTRIHISEQDAQQLIGAGAKDDRFNVVTDDPDS
ncbi:DUF3203 family protein [Pseudomonas mangiferae]|uniref:DUF3203 family protein n=1 Tax=Pseudomonas mangiferae TaxID=2593654 RepID=A0A553H1G2_9PSED|nr:DUF3203 family protein [Pseudomonas mangiferae]TRX75571.1 DUF3203 family protein [Pseudomonas mangiferae]